MKKQRLCVLAWYPPATLRSGTKEAWYAIVCGNWFMSSEAAPIAKQMNRLL
jgi:hypothetical protein